MSHGFLSKSFRINLSSDVKESRHNKFPIQIWTTLAATPIDCSTSFWRLYKINLFPPYILFLYLTIWPLYSASDVRVLILKVNANDSIQKHITKIVIGPIKRRYLFPIQFLFGSNLSLIMFDFYFYPLFQCVPFLLWN